MRRVALFKHGGPLDDGFGASVAAILIGISVADLRGDAKDARPSRSNIFYWCAVFKKKIAKE